LLRRLMAEMPGTAEGDVANDETLNVSEGGPPCRLPTYGHIATPR
jgi:hypothetical protein